MLLPARRADAGAGLERSPSVGAAAGVMVTASHNPPADNGYKVYLGDGAQIVPPVDAEISACIDAVDPCTVELRRRRRSADRVARRRSCVEAYLDAVPAVRLRPDVAGVPVAYTAMHGVGGDTLVAAFDRAGLADAARRGRAAGARRHVPDGVVPEPRGAGRDGPAAGAGRRRAARAIALANDPDADRLGAAIPTARRRLAAAAAATRSAGCSPTTSCATRRATTAWSSPRSCRRRCSAQMAAAHGVHCAETFTGLQVDRPHRARATRAALRVRLRAGARLPGVRPTARQGRHHRGGADGRGRRARRRRGRDAAGSARRDRRPLRPPRDGRAVGADAAGRRRRGGARDCAASPPTEVGGRAGHRRSSGSTRPACCGCNSAPSCACRSARAAPSRRSSSTAKASTSTRRPTCDLGRLL